MAGRELAAHGVVVLLLLMPSGVLAQLPNAPTPADSVQGARHLQADQAAIQNNLEREWVVRTAVTLADHSDSSAGVQQVAYEEVGGLGRQQTFAPPSRRRFGRTYSSSTTYMREVAGEAPALQNTCPVNFCPVRPVDMCCEPASSPFEQYLKWPDVVPVTAEDNWRSAVRGVIDPFNLVTIGADAAIGIGSDSHTPYGPGFEGFAKYSGVSLTEDITGEFFGTFLVPSLVHQDPHYHREPFLPLPRRILHTFLAVVWSQSYTGKPMFNYANIVGGIATAVVSNTFVPGRDRQGVANTARRLALAFAISPSGNMIQEFVPDLASHVNLRVVIFQRILNTVTLEESGVMQ